MEGCFKFLLGLFIIWLVVTAIPFILWFLIGYAIYKLGEWAYNEWNNSTRD